MKCVKCMEVPSNIWSNVCSVAFVPRSEGKLADIEVKVDFEKKNLNSSVTEK